MKSSNGNCSKDVQGCQQQQQVYSVLPFLYMVLPYKQGELRNNVFHLLILIKKSIVSQIII